MDARLNPANNYVNIKGKWYLYTILMALIALFSHFPHADLNNKWLLDLKHLWDAVTLNTLTEMLI